MNETRVSIVGMRQQAGSLDALLTANAGDLLELRREPENRFDKNAIQVYLSIWNKGKYLPILLGYIAKESTHKIPSACQVARLEFTGENRMPVAVIHECTGQFDNAVMIPDGEY